MHEYLWMTEECEKKSAASEVHFVLETEDAHIFHLYEIDFPYRWMISTNPKGTRVRLNQMYEDALLEEIIFLPIFTCLLRCAMASCI